MNAPKYELLNVDDIQLDLANPRIAKWIEMYGPEPTAEQISLALGAGDSQLPEGSPTFSSLKASIRTNNGLIHPILVNREEDGTLVAIEGNTRTAIFREFRQQGVPGDWECIPAMVYDQLSRSEVDAIRLQSHLVGPRDWDPYSKAKYLTLLRDMNQLTLGQIVDFCGGKKQEVQSYITAYHDMEHHYRPLLDSDQDFDPTRFSAFVELQKPRITTALVHAGFDKTTFAEWIISRRIHPLVRVRDLPRVLQNPKSREAFLASGMDEALKLLDQPTTDASLKEATLCELTHELLKRLAAIPWATVVELRQDPSSDQVATFLNARDRLADFCNDITSDGEE
jgi:hypothetical protein